MPTVNVKLSEYENTELTALKESRLMSKRALLREGLGLLLKEDLERRVEKHSRVKRENE